MLTLAPSRLFTGEAVREGAAVRVRDGRVEAVLDAAPADAVRLEGLLAPGLVDAQVNGGGGVLFNDAPTLETLRTIAAAHARFGVTGLMATLISDDRAKAARAIEAVAAAVAEGVGGVLGLHLEGPWLAPPRRGVHPERFLRAFDDDDMALLTARRAFPLLVTVAPEQVDAARVRALAAAGVIVSLGHTAAAAEDVDAALAAGAAGFTHLFNAMPPLEGRKPGAVGAALAHRASWAGLILDGVHVHPVSARAAFAAKGPGKLMLVSDAMATVGAEDASMTLAGETISVRDGALRTATGTLAGAHLDLATAARNAVALIGATTEEALRMASRTPAEFLGVARERGHIAPGMRADFVLLDDALTPRGTWIGGDRAA